MFLLSELGTREFIPGVLVFWYMLKIYTILMTHDTIMDTLDNIKDLKDSCPLECNF